MSNYWNHFNDSDLGVTVKEVTEKNQNPVPLYTVWYNTIFFLF